SGAKQPWARRQIHHATADEYARYARIRHAPDLALGVVADHFPPMRAEPGLVDLMLAPSLRKAFAVLPKRPLQIDFVAAHCAPPSAALASALGVTSCASAQARKLGMW